MDGIKLCGALLLCAVTALLLGQVKEVFARLVLISAMAVAGIWAIGVAAPMLADFSALISDTPAGTLYPVLLKALGMGMLTQYTAGAVREMGQEGFATTVEFTGKVLIMVQAYPLLRELMAFAGELLQV